jgi:hypothetical protein
MVADRRPVPDGNGLRRPANVWLPVPQLLAQVERRHERRRRRLAFGGPYPVCRERSSLAGRVECHRRPPREVRPMLKVIPETNALAPAPSSNRPEGSGHPYSSSPDHAPAHICRACHEQGLGHSGLPQPLCAPWPSHPVTAESPRARPSTKGRRSLARRHPSRASGGQ